MMLRFGAVKNGVSSPFDGASRCVLFVQYPAGGERDVKLFWNGAWGVSRRRSDGNGMDWIGLACEGIERLGGRLGSLRLD